MSDPKLRHMNRTSCIMTRTSHIGFLAKNPRINTINNPRAVEGPLSFSDVQVRPGPTQWFPMKWKSNQ